MPESVEALQGQILQLVSQAEEELHQAADLKALEDLRVKYLGRRGLLAGYFPSLKDPGLSPEGKARLGKALNSAKEKLEVSLQSRRQALAPAGGGKSPTDLTLPGYLPLVGRQHPVTKTIEEILRVFEKLGFSAVDGPETETEFYNFEALNIPPDHPSRESFDTFYLREGLTHASSKGKGGGRLLLRSHTSPVQVRFMQQHRPPFKIVVPGRVFRPDAVDSSHCFQFHQVEGLAVGTGLTFGDLKGVLITWVRQMFGEESQLRFRPHYFPFTEPSAEVDLACSLCRSKGCRVCGRKGWLEILGCGMVHPAVFRACGYTEMTQGFAFGMGVERIAMLRHRIEDIRLFFENDLRFLRQFA